MQPALMMSLGIDDFSLTANTGTTSFSSDIIANTSYTYNNNIDYKLYQAPTITSASNSTDVFQFDIRDGSSSGDADDLPTVLNTITFSSVQNINSIRTAALFDGNTLVSNNPTINTTNGTIAFSGLSATATDNGLKTLTLRVSFKTTVMEGQLRFSILSAGAAATLAGSSGFGSFATVTSSVTPATRNKVEVTATKLLFQQQPASTAAGTVINPNVKVVAGDVNNSIDVDYTTAIVLNLTSTGICNSLTGSTATPVSGVATFTNLSVNIAETNISLTASSGSLATATSSPFAVTGGVATTGTVVSWNFEDGNTTQDAGNSYNTVNTITTTANNTLPSGSLYPIGTGGSGTKAFTSSGWNEGNGTKYWLITVNTTNAYSLTLSSRQSSSNNGPRNFKIQYQTSTSSAWVDLVTLPDITTPAPNFTQAVASSLVLPDSCDNQPTVNIRWIMASNQAVNGSIVTAEGTSRIDDIIITGQTYTGVPAFYYRSAQSGDFGSACTWESSSNGNIWSAATVPPDFTSNTITVLNTHTVTINSARTADQLVVNTGGTLVLNDYVLTLHDGPGADLTVNGTYINNASAANNTVFNTGATWLLGGASTYIKTRNASTSVYQGNYQSGINTIPETANWIIRYTGKGDVSFATVGASYPNLTFESTSGDWNPSIQSSRFNGATGFVTIKGNLNIGGSGTGTVTIYNQNTNMTSLLVQGSLTVQTGSTLTNNGASQGTGFEVKGNITVNGTLTANGAGSSGVLNLTGGAQQSIAGSGIINLNDVAINNTETGITAGILLNRNLTIGGNLTMTLGPLVINGRTLTLTGGLTRTNGSLTGSVLSDLVLDGDAAKTLYFTNPGNVLHNLRVNTPATHVSLGNALDITSGTNGTDYGTVICDGALQTNGYLTLQSSEQGTAAVGTSQGLITGNVTVERFTNGNKQQGQSRRAWRLMTSPVANGQTIRQAWQEDRNDNSAYGTLITGEGFPNAGTAAAQGYDYIGYGNHTSIKHYVPGANGGAWLPLSSDDSATGTNIPVRNEEAYMLFVRGNRTIRQPDTSGIATLRATGTLLQGDKPVALSPGSYTLAGNPYAATLDFKKLIGDGNNSNVIKDQFYLWNSKLGRYGAYILINRNSVTSPYQATPSPLTGSNSPEIDDAYRYIPSGSGFFVSPNTGVTSGTFTIREPDKADLPGSQPPVNPFRETDAQPARQLLVNLNLKDSDTSTTLADGFRALFSDGYSGYEEENSSGKTWNFDENLNLVHNGKAHIIEARSEIKAADTLFVQMWNVSKRKYELQMRADDFVSAPGVQAWLADGYLKTKQEISLKGDVATIDFEVNNDSLSAKSDRFMIVFRNSSAVLPVTLTGVKAQAQNGGVEVAWTVTNEVNIKGYTVEKSTDGRTFTTIGVSQLAKNNGQAALINYSGYDAQPKNGDNYYRIKIEGTDGKISYSEVVKVTIGNAGTGIQIALYPNPVREGKANLQLTNLEEGTYLVGVYSGSGQTIYQKKITITTGGTTQTEPLLLGKGLAQGSYQMRVADNKGTVLFTDKLIVGR